MSSTWWVSFFGLISLLLYVDLAYIHRRNKQFSYQKSLIETLIWIGIALTFNLFVYFRLGEAKAVEFFTAYLIEKSLSIDNLFVFMIIFSFYAVPDRLQHRVLFYGIIGTIVLRAIFILIGIELISAFHFIMYPLSLLIIYAGVQFLRKKEFKADPQNNMMVRFIRKFIPVSKDYEGTRFLFFREGKLYATPLFIVLVVVESTDIVFAIDSIPAIFGISKDPFIVYTSNIFAILGLRSLYFVVNGALQRFSYMKYGLGLILIFIGIKIMTESFLPINQWISMWVIVFILLTSLIASVLIKPDLKTQKVKLTSK